MTKSSTSWKRTFFIFWISQASSLLGSSLVQFALVWWITQTTGSASILAAASTIAVLPEILISPFAGAIIDRTNRKKMMILADTAIAAITIVLAIFFLLDIIEIWHIYVIMFVRSAGSAFHYPAEQASISLMVPGKQLSRIAGLNQAMQGGINIAAPALGALTLELLGVQGTLIIDVITAALAIVLLMVIHIPQPKQISKNAQITLASLWKDMLAGFHYITQWKGMFAITLIAMGFKFALSPAFSLMPLLVSKHFNGSASQYALTESLGGIGLVLGGILLGIWGGFKKRIYTIWFGLTVLGLCMLFISFLLPSQFTAFLFAMFILGLMIPLIDGPFTAILQANVEPDFQGRVMTIVSSLLWITTPLGLSIAGPVSDHFGLSIWYAIAGLLCVASTIVGIMLPFVRNLE